MKVSDLINEFQNYVDSYGDFEVVMRINEEGVDDMDFETLSVYLDEDEEKLVISDDF